MSLDHIGLQFCISEDLVLSLQLLENLYLVGFKFFEAGLNSCNLTVVNINLERLFRGMFIVIGSIPNLRLMTCDRMRGLPGILVTSSPFHLLIILVKVLGIDLASIVLRTHLILLIFIVKTANKSKHTFLFKFIILNHLLSCTPSHHFFILLVIKELILFITGDLINLNLLTF